MLENTFLHIPTIGEKTESRLWQEGYLTWQDYERALEPPLKGNKHKIVKEYLLKSKLMLEKGDMYFFYQQLKGNESWRLFRSLKQNAAFLDIETTGLGHGNDHITTIALYANESIYYYIYGENLDQFPKDLEKYDIIVTFNGKLFDIPFIEHFFNIKINKPHIDLRFLLKSLGYSGGLKKCEKSLGIDRGGLDGVDGYFAVLLWQEYINNNNYKALETLLAYNIEDAVNLASLMEIAHNKKILTTPFKDKIVSIKISDHKPFRIDLETVNIIKEKILKSKVC